MALRAHKTSLLMTALMFLSGCGGQMVAFTPNDDFAASQPPPAGRSQTYVGRLDGTGALIGLLIDGDRVIAYITDGSMNSPLAGSWLQGTVDQGRLSLDGDEGAGSSPSRLSGLLQGGIMQGAVLLANGVQLPWQAEAADTQSPAGLYVHEGADAVTGMIITNDLQMAGGSMDRSGNPLGEVYDPQPAPQGGDGLEVAVSDAGGSLLELLNLIRLDRPLINLPISAVQPVDSADGIAMPEPLQPDGGANPGDQDPYADSRIAAPEDVLQVKFRDGLRIRLAAQDPRDPQGSAMPVDLDGQALTSPQARQLLEMLRDGQWARAHLPAADQLDELRQKAMKRTGESYPDLNLYFSLKLPAGMDRRKIIEELNRLEEVARAYAMPDYYLPIAPDYSAYRGTFVADGAQYEYPYQKYLDAAPAGVDARFAWEMPGGRGQDVNVVLLEYAYNADHGDLPNITLDGIPSPNPTPLHLYHGTSTWGVIAGRPDGIGVTGIAHGARPYFVPATLGNFAGIGWAIGLDGVVINTLVSQALRPGDVMVLELQTAGPNGAGAFVPVEWEEQVFHAIRIATANGLVVVEAAGNGSQDLDGAAFVGDPLRPHEPFVMDGGERAHDSGAIIVGAGAPDAHWTRYFGYDPHERLSFSTHGGRVDVHAWGDAVVTCASSYLTPQNTLYDDEGENMAFHSDYGGTSSATAIVGGVVAALQGAYKADNDGAVLSAHELRRLLIDSGTPQVGNDGHIGPMPNLRAAIESFTVGLPGIEPLPFAERPVADAFLYCSGLRMPEPGFSLESGMLEFAEGPLDLDTNLDLGDRIQIPGIVDLGPIGDLLGGAPSKSLELEFGPVLIEGSLIYYTLDGTVPALCSGGPGCGSTQVWTWEDSLQGNRISITAQDLPLTVLAKMTTTACGGGNQPESALAVATYVPYSEIPAPIIHVGSGPVVHQESKIFSPQDLFNLTAQGVLETPELCVKFDFNGAAGSPYIRYTLDGSDPLDTTENWWLERDGVGPDDASPIWTDYNIDQGQCIPIFSVNDPAGTVVTVKAQNFVYPGAGPYIGGAMAVETYILDF